MIKKKAHYFFRPTFFRPTFFFDQKKSDFENLKLYIFFETLFLYDKIIFFIRIFFYHLVCAFRMLDTHLEHCASLVTTRNQLRVWLRYTKSSQKHSKLGKFPGIHVMCSFRQLYSDPSASRVAAFKNRRE